MIYTQVHSLKAGRALPIRLYGGGVGAARGGRQGRANSTDSKKPEKETHAPRSAGWGPEPCFLGCLGPASRGPKRTQSGSPGWKLTSALPAGHEGAVCLPLPPGCRAHPVLRASPRPQEMPHFHKLAPCGGELPRNQNSHCECGLGVKAWERASLSLSVTASSCSSLRCLWRM